MAKATSLCIERHCNDCDVAMFFINVACIIKHKIANVVERKHLSGRDCRELNVHIPMEIAGFKSPFH